MPTHRYKPTPQPAMLSPRAKWWEFELRFGRALTKREQRWLSSAVGSTWSAKIGCDGVAPTTLESKWPDAAELRVLTAACADLPGARVRLAPLGAQHGAGCSCHPWDMDESVRVGSPDACGVDVTRCPWWLLAGGEWTLAAAT
jgi:hypothetical protein